MEDGHLAQHERCGSILPCITCPPLDRVKSIEVLPAAPVINYGPNNNHGVVNFRPSRAVRCQRDGDRFHRRLDAWQKDDGFFVDEDDELHTSIGQQSRHFPAPGTSTRARCRAMWVPCSRIAVPTSDGAWDTERLRYNDVYGAPRLERHRPGSGGRPWRYGLQRDHYDEANLEGEEGGDFDELEPTGSSPRSAHCKIVLQSGLSASTLTTPTSGTAAGRRTTTTSMTTRRSPRAFTARMAPPRSLPDGLSRERIHQESSGGSTSTGNGHVRQRRRPAVFRRLPLPRRQHARAPAHL